MQTISEISVNGVVNFTEIIHTKRNSGKSGGEIRGIGTKCVLFC